MFSRTPRWLTPILTPLLLTLALGLAWGADPPSAPMLRLETGMHTAPIRRIGLDAANRFLVTGSDDKTVRVWELATGRLLRTLRLPIGPGNEGKVYAVALSPDGRTVAVAGWTGWDWDGTHSISLFERDSGRLRRRLTGLPNVIHHLAYSRDGAFLVATLFGANGMRLYRTQDDTQVASDTAYGDRSYGADFDAAGRLVTTAYDGFVRLYARDGTLLQKRQAPGEAAIWRRLRPRRLAPGGGLRRHHPRRRAGRDGPGAAVHAGHQRGGHRQFLRRRLVRRWPHPGRRRAVCGLGRAPDPPLGRRRARHRAGPAGGAEHPPPPPAPGPGRRGVWGL